MHDEPFAAGRASSNARLSATVSFRWRGLALLLAGLLLTGCPTPRATAPLGELQLQALANDAQNIDLDDVQGQVVLINFWGPWCPYCLVEFPELMKLEAEFRERPEFRFLSVSCAADDREDNARLQRDTERYLAKVGATFPVHRDGFAITRQAVSTAAGLRGFGFPTTVLLDREGRVVDRWIGYSPGDTDQMRHRIEQLLATPPSVAGDAA